jgi:hypothetical protein
LIKLARQGHESRLRSLVLVLPPAGRQGPPDESTAITGSGLGSPFTGLASSTAGSTSTHRSATSAQAQGSDSLSPATFGVTPEDPTDGGSSDWIWIALLAATIALLPALRQLTRLTPRATV